MDDHSNLAKSNGSIHTKGINPASHIHNSVSFPSHPQPRMSYNTNFTNSNNDIAMHK